jgi:periplasmic protein TonB
MAEPKSSEQRANGAKHARLAALATAGGASVSYDDPMRQVLGLDAQTSGAVAWLAYSLASVAVMLGLNVAIRVVTLILAMNATAASSGPAQEIDVMRDETPPPPPPQEQEAKPEPAAPPRALPHEAPPPAPAQAGKVLTQEPDPNEPVDLTGNTIVTGDADSYAGGTTSSKGTSATAVRALAAPTGVPGGRGAPTAAPVAAGPDRSRPASLGPGSEWSCPFPPEADTVQMDDAYVTLQVDVRADGSLSAVRVLADPGNGFGREARRCAPSQRFQPALDRDGNPIPGTSKPFRVHFSR